MKEIISLHIGQTGIQVGNNAWEIFCLEHDISPTGQLMPTYQPRTSNAFRSFFGQGKEGTLSPRCLFIDLQPGAIADVQTGCNRKLYNQNQFVSGNEDTGHSYARGYSLGNKIMDVSLDKIRLLAQSCNDLQGFIIYHCLGGGTGSGVTALLMEQLSLQYQKKSKLNFAVYPSIQIKAPSKEVYNTVLSMHSQLQHSSISIVFDDQCISQICRKQLKYQNPSPLLKSSVIAQVVSTFTAPFRFDAAANSTNTNLAELQTNLVPYPKIKFIIPSYFPIIYFGKTCYDWGTTDMAQGCFQPWNRLVMCDPRKGKFMTCSLFYRGWMAPADINKTCAHLKTKKTIQFVDWCPKIYRVNLIQRPPSVKYDGAIRHQARVCGMLSNNTCISQFFGRYCTLFDQMLQEKRLTEQYLKEGLKEGQLQDAREDLKDLEEQYRLVQEPTEDQEDEVKVQSLVK